jgi:hypothetical protein
MLLPNQKALTGESRKAPGRNSRYLLRDRKARCREARRSLGSFTRPPRKARKYLAETRIVIREVGSEPVQLGCSPPP